MQWSVNDATCGEMEWDAVASAQRPCLFSLMIPFPCFHSYFFWCFLFPFSSWNVFGFSSSSTTFLFCPVNTLYFSTLLKSLNSPSHPQLMPLIGYHLDLYLLTLPLSLTTVFFFLSTYNGRNNSSTCVWNPICLSSQKLCCFQPKCLSTDEWIKKIWYIYTMETTQP